MVEEISILFAGKIATAVGARKYPSPGSFSISCYLLLETSSISELKHHYAY